MIRLNTKYLLFCIVLFIIEILIALYLHDRFIRPFVGDVLVVILMYCFVLSFFNVSKIKTAVGVLLFSFGIEFTQYLNLIGVLGFEQSKLARMIMGTSFAFEDLLCYLLGISLVILTEKLCNKSIA